MFRLAGAIVVASLAAAGASKATIDYVAHRSVAQPSVAAVSRISSPSATTASADGTGASISKASDGHFWAQADIGGHPVKLLVDTGASAVILTPADAARLGYPAASLVFDRTILTANGQAAAAMIVLPRISVSGVSVAQVPALVAQKGLDDSLLGMSFLGRLSRFEATPNAMILRS